MNKLTDEALREILDTAFRAGVFSAIKAYVKKAKYPDCETINAMMESEEKEKENESL